MPTPPVCRCLVVASSASAFMSSCNHGSCERRVLVSNRSVRPQLVSHDDGHHSLRSRCSPSIAESSEEPNHNGTSFLREESDEDDESAGVQRPDGYASVLDTLGCPAFENTTTTTVLQQHLPNQYTTKNIARVIGGVIAKFTSSNGEIQSSLCSKTSCVRLQARPCLCFDTITTKQHVLLEIDNVRKLQQQYRRADLYSRYWEPLETICNSNTPMSNKVSAFTVMQFNALAEGLSSGPSALVPFEHSKRRGEFKAKGHFGGFTNIPHPEVTLDFALRRWRLLEVIVGSSLDTGIYDGSSLPDILAMEEVDRYHGFFEPALRKFGYRGLFVPKPAAPGISLGFYSDGCALFWKHETFELLSEKRGGFDIGTQVYIVATLRHCLTGRTIVVAATHLKAQQSDTNEKIRTTQASQLVTLVRNAASEQIAANGNNNSSLEDVPILIMGDFNSDPVGKGKTCVKSIIGRSEYPRFQSCYSIDLPHHYTTWKNRGETVAKRISDYIFYNGIDVRAIRCTHTLSIPSEDEIEPEHLPGFRYPSDHIAIASKFDIDPL